MLGVVAGLALLAVVANGQEEVPSGQGDASRIDPVSGNAGDGLPNSASSEKGPTTDTDEIETDSIDEVSPLPTEQIFPDGLIMFVLYVQMTPSHPANPEQELRCTHISHPCLPVTG